jgi:hypothetical protein
VNDSANHTALENDEEGVGNLDALLPLARAEEVLATIRLPRKNVEEDGSVRSHAVLCVLTY